MRVRVISGGTGSQARRRRGGENVGMVPLTHSERSALRDVQGTFETLDRWRARSRRLEVPQAESEAALDDAIWPQLPPSDLARQSLQAATQHLNLARTAIEAADIYPTAHYTVFRGGLVGASQAVWLLGPDERMERQQRGLRVVDEWYKRAAQNQREYLSLASDEASRKSFQEASDFLDMRRKEARTRWAATGSLTEGEELNLTSVIEWSAGEVFQMSQSRIVKALWQELSSDAHVLGWSVVGRSVLDQRDRDDPKLAILRAGGNLEHIRDVFMLVHRILKRGWSLYDQRCEATPH